MFCPNCGANNTTEQKFCRSCGLNLEKTAESLLLQIPSAESANLLKQERLLEKFGNLAFGGFGLVLLIGVSALIYVVVTKFILSGTNIFVGILLVAFIIFADLALAYVIFAEFLKGKKKKIGFNETKENKGLEKAKDTARLLEEKTVEPISSVTENTTNLLFVESKRKTSGELN